MIAGAIDAPIRDALYDVLAEAGEGVPHGLRGEVHALVSRLVHPVADVAERLWQKLSTRELRTLSLPDRTVVLG